MVWWLKFMLKRTAVLWKWEEGNLNGTCKNIKLETKIPANGT